MLGLGGPVRTQPSLLTPLPPSAATTAAAGTRGGADTPFQGSAPSSSGRAAAEVQGNGSGGAAGAAAGVAGDVEGLQGGGVGGGKQGQRAAGGGGSWLGWLLGYGSGSGDDAGVAAAASSRGGDGAKDGGMQHAVGRDDRAAGSGVANGNGSGAVGDRGEYNGNRGGPAGTSAGKVGVDPFSCTCS